MNKTYSREELEYFDRNKAFKEECEDWDNLDSEITRTRLREIAVYHDGELNFELKEYHNMSLEDFIRKHSSYYTFSEKVEFKITGRRTSREKRQYLPAVVKKLKTGKFVCSPRFYNYLRYQTKNADGRIALPSYSLKANGIINAVYHKLSKGFDYGIQEDKIFFDSEEFSIIAKDNSKAGNIVIKFSTREIRKILNVKWTDKQIVSASYELRDSPIQVEEQKIIPDEKGNYKEKYSIRFGICNFVAKKKTKRLAPRTKDIQHDIAFGLNDIALALFLTEIFQRKYSLLPIKDPSLFREREGVQILYHYLSIWADSCLNIPLVRNILGYSKKTSIRQIIERVQGYLDRLFELGLIQNYIIKRGKTKASIQWWVGVSHILTEKAVEKRLHSFKRIKKEIKARRRD